MHKIIRSKYALTSFEYLKCMEGGGYLWHSDWHARFADKKKGFV
jgi:hypothetical protein